MAKKTLGDINASPKLCQNFGSLSERLAYFRTEADLARGVLWVFDHPSNPSGCDALKFQNKRTLN